MGDNVGVIDAIVGKNVATGFDGIIVGAIVELFVKIIDGTNVGAGVTDGITVTLVGAIVGESLYGANDGLSVATTEGFRVGEHETDGFQEGASLGIKLGLLEGASVGTVVGKHVGARDGETIKTFDGYIVGSLLGIWVDG